MSPITILNILNILNIIISVLVFWLVVVFCAALLSCLLFQKKNKANKKKGFTQEEYNALYLQHYYPNIYYGRQG